MQTTTIRITRQEFETIIFALRAFQDEDSAKDRAKILRWYQDNEEFPLLEAGAIDDLIEKINTSSCAPRCVTCGWDATVAYNSASNSYCDLCKDNAQKWPTAAASAEKW